MTELRFASEEWWNRYKDIVNSDEEMQVRGHGLFDENFHVDVDGDRNVIVVDGGRVDVVLTDPAGDDEVSLGVAGSRDVWNEFLQEVPPANNHDIFASYITSVTSESDGLTISGDQLAIWQNLRPLQRMTELLRETHNTGGDDR